MRVLILVCLVSVVSFLYAAEDKEHLLTVLFTNDDHGMAWKYDEPGNPGIGGLAARKTLIDQIKDEVQAKGGNVLVLDSGDITLGDPRSNICLNKPFIQGMNLIGYDAMAIGSHEFDFGIDAFNQMKKEARFPLLSANIYHDGGKKAVGDEYIEKKFSDGLKVAVIGLTTPDIEKISSQGVMGKLVVTDPVEAVKTRVPLLRKKDDLVIVLSNLGYYEGDKSYDGLPGDSYLAKEVPGINLIIGGHTQIQMKAPVKIGDTYIVQTEGYGKWVGRVDLYISGKKITKVDYRTYPVNLKEKVIGKNNKVTYNLLEKEVPENQAMLKLLNGFKCDFPATPLTKLAKPLSGDRKIVRSGESELGDIIADVIKDKVKTDVVLFNSGSIRQGLSAGVVTERDVYNVFPFNDTIFTGKIKGIDLQEVLDYLAEKGVGTGGFLQVAGITFKLYKGAALDIKINGEPLNKKKFYTIAITSFLANGGDGYYMLKNLKTKKDTALSIPALLVDYLKANKAFPQPAGGRIIIVK